MASDLEQLIDMGFEKERAELAVKATGGRTYIEISSRQIYPGILTSG